jgi:CubicO group peptidase (beta-lactamase class C family)
MRLWHLALSALVLAASQAAAQQSVAPRFRPAPGHLSNPVPLKLTFIPQAPLRHPLFDAQAFQTRFASDMEKFGALNYIVEFRINGNVLFILKSGYAQAPGDGNAPWAAGIPMHIASVSKTLTAMAMVKLLDSLQNPATNPYPYKNPIAAYLPKYWTQGPGLGAISFRDLLTMHSGFAPTAQQEGYPNYQSLKGVIATGSGGDANYVYQNVNYSLMRILIAVLTGDIDRNTIFSTDAATNDAMWDAQSIASYSKYLQTNVFAPSLVSGATLTHTPSAALGYYLPPASPGWNSGDLSSIGGGAGWHLSIDDLLATMGAYMRGGTIVTPGEALATLQQGFGVDEHIASPLGQIYGKGGYFYDATTWRTEQSGAMFVPGANIEAADYINMFMGKSPGAENLLIGDFIASIREGSPFDTDPDK